MLTITTTDRQINISQNGSTPKGDPKGSLRYAPFDDRLEIYFAANSKPYFIEKWSNGITLNGATVTRDNVSEVLEPLFN